MVRESLSLRLPGQRSISARVLSLAFASVLTLVFGAGCAFHPRPVILPVAGTPTSAEPPPAPREFRAVWVATVANIDWPSAPGLSTGQQQAEARDLIAQARALGLNAIILQVRPAADALYESTLEPWSESLTGTQGRAPEPRYDPLAFWVGEAHRAGLELHAWFNPYRARPSSARSPLAASHVGLRHSEWVKAYGDMLWLDPGDTAAEAHTLGVILDVVRRYDVDGVHLDDYFYPYPVKDASSQAVDFPDEPSWKAYLARGGTLLRADWRRQNVDGFIERLGQAVHREKPLVRVGVSPFGLGRPDRRPAGITGFSQYDDLYAHAERWLEQGWVDYLVPQLYWKRDSPGQAFEPLLDYWRAQNPKGRHVWPGLFTSRIGSSEPWPANEIAGQIELVRSRGGDMGHAHFSAVALKKDAGGIRGVLAGLYGGPALVPASPWLSATPPSTPAVEITRVAKDPATLNLRLLSGEAPWLLAVWARYGGAWHFFTMPGGAGSIPARMGEAPLDRALASSVGPTGLESPRGAVQDSRY